MLTRRQFLNQASVLSMTPLVFSPQSIVRLHELNETRTFSSPQKLAADDKYWAEVRKAFHQSPEFINLENGYYCPMPLATLEDLNAQWTRINAIPSYYMRNHLEQDRSQQKERLAELAGCEVEELVITRNTTEALNTVILGLKMNPGDEAVFCDQDYMSMQEAFRQKARREGIINRVIALPLHPQDDQEIVNAYREAINERTRVLLVTHLINISGQILPVRKICDMAHERGVEVIVDGAHSFAHLDFKIPDLHCDYYGASLHKWLCTPLGLGLMYVKKDKIDRVWPLFGDDTFDDHDIRKFEHIGTHPVPIRAALMAAIDFHVGIGPARKQARLHFLKHYWISRVQHLPKVIINTPLDAARSCAIGNIAVEGMTPTELADHFWNSKKIFTVAIDRESVKGVRVTPHLYTASEELDLLVEAVKEVA